MTRLVLFFLFCFVFFLIPFLARENDFVCAMLWQGRNCENWLNSRNEQMADDRRPKTMITSARDDCYAFFFRYAYCNVQYTVSQRMMTTVLMCIISTVNMEFQRL